MLLDKKIIGVSKLQYTFDIREYITQVYVYKVILKITVLLKF